MMFVGEYFEAQNRLPYNEFVVLDKAQTKYYEGGGDGTWTIKDLFE